MRSVQLRWTGRAQWIAVSAAVALMLLGVACDSSALLEEDGPDPYFPGEHRSAGYSYDPSGILIEARVSIEVRNRGGPGKVFAYATCGRNLGASTVLDMGEGETVKVTAHFDNAVAGWFSGPQRRCEWTARAASLGDISEGEMEVERR